MNTAKYDKDLFSDKHFLIKKADLKYINDWIKNDPNIKNFSDALRKLISNSQETEKLREEVARQKKDNIKVKAMSKELSCVKELVGELLFIDSIDRIKHGASPELVASAEKLVDKKIKKAQERVASNSFSARKYDDWTNISEDDEWKF